MTPFEEFQRLEAIAPLPKEQQQRLFAQATSRTLRKGAQAWREGQPISEIFLTMRGWFKLERSSGAGNDVIVSLLGPGQLTCIPAAVTRATHCCSCVALEDDAVIAALPVEAVLGTSEPQPMHQLLLRTVASQAMGSCSRLTQLSNGTVDQRLAALLLELTSKAGLHSNRGTTRVPVPLSRADLAHLTATTPETVIRRMRFLEQQGIVQTVTHGFLVLDPARLQAVARGEELSPAGN